MKREYDHERTRAAVAIAVLLSLCIWIPQRAMAQQAKHALAGTTWRLASLTMSGKTVAPDDRTKYTLSFQDNGKVAVHAGCNRGTGPYKDPTGALEIGPITLTKAHCPPGSIADQFARALGFTQSYTLTDGNLLLGVSSTGDTVRFERTKMKGK
jgi:heat shock protein HslJ